MLKKDQDTKPQHEFRKKGSGIWGDIVYRKRPSETRAFAGKLIAYGKTAGADTRLNEKMTQMICEIEDGTRRLGFHNFDELEAYGSHLIDLMRWLGGEFGSVAATMRNFIPDRVIRGEPGRQRILIEDGATALVEYANGTQGMLQTSHIAVGNYPCVEIRVHGSKGAAIAQLIDENGIAETLKFATADQVEFQPVAIAQAALPPGTTLNTPWPELYYRNLVRHFVDEILEDRPQECAFHDGAKRQEIVDAVIKVHDERRWVDLAGKTA